MELIYAGKLVLLVFKVVQNDLEYHKNRQKIRVNKREF